MGEGTLLGRGKRSGLAFVEDAMGECGMWDCGGTYVDNGLLALDPDLQVLLGHVYYDVFAA